MRGPLRQTSTARLTGSDNSDKQQRAAVLLPFLLPLKSNGNPTGRPCVSYFLLPTSLSPSPYGGEYRIRTDDPLLAKQVL